MTNEIKRMQQLAGLIVEEWNPNDKYEESYLTDKKDLQDENTIKQFVEFHNLNPQVIDIWEYAKDKFQIYPAKITTRGMVYWGKSFKLELELKGQDKINMYVFNRDEKIQYADKFNFEKFNHLFKK